jgi:transposase
MDSGSQALAERVATLEAALAGAEARASAAEARAASGEALIAHLKLEIQKLSRDRFGPSSERSRRLLDQMELQLEELEASATEDELLAEAAAAKTTTVAGFTRKRPSRKPFPEHLPREQVVIAAPAACPCCGGTRLSKLGEDVTETLEVVPRSWKPPAGRTPDASSSCWPTSPPARGARPRARRRR